MYLFRMRSLLMATFAAAVVAAGCGEGTVSSPTAPSALSESTTLDFDLASGAQASVSGEEFVALDSGNRGGGKDKGKDKQEEDKSDRGRRGEAGSHEDDDDDEGDADAADNHGRRRNLSGSVTAVGTSSITIRGIAVTVTPTTVIRHGNRRLTLAQIAVGDHAQAKGTMSADETTLAASEIKVEDTGRDNDDEDDEDDEDANEVDLKGAVAALGGTCPALTFTIGTTTVHSNASTTFDDVTCAALANGNTVEVKGERQTDGSVLAESVELESGPNEVEGRISGLTGTCPGLTFTIGTTTVTTSGSTAFSGAVCTALANGAKVEVEGTLTGTTLAASTVEVD